MFIILICVLSQPSCQNVDEKTGLDEINFSVFFNSLFARAWWAASHFAMRGKVKLLLCDLGLMPTAVSIVQQWIHPKGIEIQWLRSYWEVVWDPYGGIPSALCTQMSPGLQWWTAQSNRKEATTIFQLLRKQKRQNWNLFSLQDKCSPVRNQERTVCSCNLGKSLYFDPFRF